MKLPCRRRDDCPLFHCTWCNRHEDDEDPCACPKALLEREHHDRVELAFQRGEIGPRDPDPTCGQGNCPVCPSGDDRRDVDAEVAAAERATGWSSQP